MKVNVRKKTMQMLKEIRSDINIRAKKITREGHYIMIKSPSTMTTQPTQMCMHQKNRAAKICKAKLIKLSNIQIYSWKLQHSSLNSY